MTATCALTDLDTAMCSHCRGLDKPDVWAVVWRGVAQYRGRCENCDRRINEGDPIGLTAGESIGSPPTTVNGLWVCQRCMA